MDAKTDTKTALKQLRQKHGLTQDEMAERLIVTRQAVSRWETGETVPNTDTLKLISKNFGVSINALLGQPRNTICQVCGSPLDDADNYSREADGTLNEQYCKWCYIDGVHQYHDPEELIAYVIQQWNWGTPEQMSEFLRKQLSELEYWREKK
jgi:transcriptional regulator with XRE-family HTH domain